MSETQGAPATAVDTMRHDVVLGLRRPQKEISSKYFYDTRGSELFEEITRLPEYYLTRTERRLLAEWVPRWFEDVRPAALLELGAGSATKTRILLDAMDELGTGHVFAPLDVSDEFLRETAERVGHEYPTFDVRPLVADFTDEVPAPRDLPTPAVWALLGSTLGNFSSEGAVRLLSRVRAAMRPSDVFLMGADLRPGAEKSVEALESAYDDEAGVTAAFNLNVLEVLNRELGADFDPGAFRHRAFYEPTRGRIEMHLVATRPQTVTIPGEDPVRFEEGESVRTEISCKYDRDSLEAILGAAGLSLREWASEDGFYAILLAVPA